MSVYGGFEDPRSDQGPTLEIQGDNSTVDPGQTEDGGQPTGAPQQGQKFDPTGWALNFKGQQVYPRDRQHLVDLAQQGWSYSQSMEQLNSQRKELDDKSAKYSEYQNLDEAMQKNPELAQRINQMYTDYANGQTQQQGTDQATTAEDPIIGQLRQEMHDVLQWKSQQESNQADTDLNNTIQSLKDKYPDSPWEQDTGHGTLQQRVINHALNKDIRDFELAYKDYMYDNIQANTKADTLREQKEQTQKNFNNGIVDTGYAGASQQNTGAGYDPNDDYGDISAKAISLLGG